MDATQQTEAFKRRKDLVFDIIYTILHRLIMQRPTYGKATKSSYITPAITSSVQRRAPQPTPMLKKTVPVRKPKEVVLSTDPVLKTMPWVHVLQAMEAKPRIKWVGVLGRVFNNKDVEIDLVNTDYQDESAPNDAAMEQLLQAGFTHPFLQAIAQGELPEGCFFPLKQLADGTWRIKVKAAVPDLLSGIRDEEAEYGYARDLLVRAVVVPRLWKMVQNQTYGFVLDIVQLEVVQPAV